MYRAFLPVIVSSFFFCSETIILSHMVQEHTKAYLEVLLMKRADIWHGEGGQAPIKYCKCERI